MDHKKSPIRRQKRTSKVLEDNFWDCSVCTFRNTAEAFKCSMCDVRKGTSTRKPRLNSALAAQQAATLPGASTAATGSSGGSGSGTTSTTSTTNGHSHHATSHGHASGSSSGSSSNHHNNHHNSSSNHNSSNHSSVGGGSGSGTGSSSHPKPPKVSRSKAKHKKYPARLTNVDRSTAQTREVTVNSVTVVITEYKPKAVKQQQQHQLQNAAQQQQQQQLSAQPPPPSRRASSEQSMSESNDSRS